MEKEEPWLLVGSPRCDPFSQIQSLNRGRVYEEKRELRLEEGRRGLEVAVDAYLAQHRAGRYFVHEHPKGAASWLEDCVGRLKEEPGCVYVEGPMCRWEMRLPDHLHDESDGIREYVRKETGFITNSPHIAQTLSGRCSNFTGGAWHRHRHLVGGVAQYASRHPPKLVAAVLRALRMQLREDGAIGSVEEVAGPVPDIPIDYEAILREGGGFWDDFNGGWLPTYQVLAARREDIEWVRKEKVYEIVPKEEAIRQGVRPIDVI